MQTVAISLFCTLLSAAEASFVNQLGSKQFRLRNQATVILEKALDNENYPAFLAVKKTRRHKNQETARRAKLLFDKYHSSFAVDATYLHIYFDPKKNTKVLETARRLNFRIYVRHGKPTDICVYTCETPYLTFRLLKQLRSIPGVVRVLVAKTFNEVPPGGYNYQEMP